MQPYSTADRRQFLVMTGVGAAGLAGCTEQSERDAESGPQPTSGNEQATQSDPTPSTGNDIRTVSVIVQPDPTALREAQANVSTALEEGEIDRAEAEQELAEREQELIAAAIEDASDFIDRSGAQHRDTVESEGTLLVDGPSGTVLDLLEMPAISAILSPERFEAAQQRVAGDGDNEALPIGQG
ncbi:hypothetical protein D8Y22_11560 [Salinadaptatus halalkaliphilus]|uniref:Uncharacterized protein n=1 Tax=Salinadaptatus halalkaliphilus TaxID=2419781 RepID=A0A4S3TKS1_9EURY|nr:hypothetical protein [Salinadaptatus halalkaliphilus]THE64739.1 hypothetical protein D8Y22_11560 [Salinadaptatus halalkaliphilus]